MEQKHQSPKGALSYAYAFSSCFALSHACVVFFGDVVHPLCMPQEFFIGDIALPWKWIVLSEVAIKKKKKVQCASSEA